MKRSLFAIALAALAACDGSDVTAPTAAPDAPLAAASGSVQLGQQFELRVGGQATISGEALTVSFQGVPSDSRCPTGVQCVWAGNAVVQVVLSQGGKAAGLELNTGIEPRTGTYLNYEIELVSLAPYPSSKGPISQSQYRATFVVRKSPVLGQSFNLKAFNSATIAGEGLTVTFNGVLSDSRCPSDVTCFWAGNAEVQLILSKPGFATDTVVVNTGVSPQSASYNGYTVALQGLAPTPVSTSTIAPGDYVATLLVTKP
jgi:hypothetical protein